LLLKVAAATVVVVVTLKLCMSVLMSGNWTGLLKLRRDVRACEYEDVQVMWEMLKRNETEPSPERSKKRFYLNFFEWTRCTPYLCRSFWSCHVWIFSAHKIHLLCLNGMDVDFVPSTIKGIEVLRIYHGLFSLPSQLSVDMFDMNHLFSPCFFRCGMN
jgi:hypothetical protein